MHEHTFQMLFYFFSADSFVYHKLIVERTARLQIEDTDFVSVHITN
jgi:hypothetical protein